MGQERGPLGWERRRDQRRTQTAGRPGTKGELEALGSLSLGKAVGHRARGLQRLWKGVGLLFSRSGAQPRLPLGRGWSWRDFRQTPVHLLRLGPSGTAVTPSSRNGFSASLAARAMTARMLKSIIFISTPRQLTLT